MPAPVTDPYADFPPALQIHLNDFRAGVDALMDDLESGDIEPFEWRDRFAELLTVNASTAYAAGRKDAGKRAEKPKRGSKTWIWLALWVALQLDFLDGFFKAIQSRPAGADSGAFRSRARMYVTSAVAPYWYGVTEGLPIPAIPGDGSSQCGQNDRCSLRIQWVDKSKGDADVYWVLEPGAEHCQTCAVRAEKWNPLVIRDWKLVLPAAAKEIEDVCAAHKHLTGQHDQSRHAWRYSTNPSAQRGPREDDVSGVDAYQRRAARKVSYSTEQIQAARETMRVEAARCTAALKEYYQDQAALTNAVGRYETSKQKLGEKAREYHRLADPIKLKMAEKRLASEEAADRYRATGEERWRKQRDALDAQAAVLAKKLNSPAISRLEMETAELVLEKKRRETDLLSIAAISDSKHAATIESASRAYVDATEGARRTLIAHYGAQGEALRRKAVTRADRLERAARQNSAKARALRKEADLLQEELARKGDPDPFQNARVQSLHRRAHQYYGKADRQRETANAALREELRQGAPTRVKARSFDNPSPAGKAVRSQGLEDFAALAGRNPFLESYQTGLCIDREPFSRAGVAQFNLTILDLGKRNRGARILDTEKREYRAVMVHEMGHMLEAADPGIRVEALNFFRRRTAADVPSAIYGEMKIGKLDFTEYTYPDRFVEKYVGKVYRKDKLRPEIAGILRENASWGEITSMGMQYFFEDPLKLARRDPEMFRLIYALLRMNA